MIDKHDWEGHPLTPETDVAPTFLVWEIDPCLHDLGYDVAVIRDYYRMLDYLAERLAVRLDDYTEEELKTHGFKLHLKLVEYSREDYPTQDRD